MRKKENENSGKAKKEARLESQEKRRIEKLKKEKEKRMRSYRRYGRGKRKHSTMGVRSCMHAAGAAAILLFCIMISFLMHGKAAGFVGGLGILAIVCAAFGVNAGVKGMRERDRNYITCKIGLGGNILLILGLVIIFIGGF